MDYVHPRLFTVAPKEALVKAMEEMFTSDEMKFSFDSMEYKTISPVYNYNGAAYKKLTYYMVLTIVLTDSTDLSDKDMAERMASAFKVGFPNKKITIDAHRNCIKVAGTEIMFAIKDTAVTDWMFLGYDRSKTELIGQLFPRQVRQHFKLI
jgi:hypothetical protein